MEPRASGGERAASGEVLALMQKAATLPAAGAREFAALLNAKVAGGSRTYEELHRFYLALLARDAPALALELTLATLKPGESAESSIAFTFLSSTLTEWASRDAAAAKAWLDTHAARLPGREKDHADIAVTIESHRLAQLSPQALEQEMAALSTDEAMRVSGYELRTAAHVEHWLRGLGKVLANEPENFASTIGMPRLPFAELKTAVETAGLPEWHRALAAAAVARQDIGRDTAQRADWFFSLMPVPASEPERRRVQAVIGEVIRDWTRADYNAVGTWLRDQTPGPLRDLSIRSFAHQVLVKEPPSAVDWALTISDAGERAAVLRSLNKEWAAHDPAAAAAYFTDKGIALSP